jgi:HPt (histidine-containing phosphotransfer) domain-containing protein
MASPSNEMLAAVWQRGLPRLRGRLDELDRAAADGLGGTLSTEAREQAASIAHQLAGSLGMFGFTESTDTARELELLLEAPGPVDSLTLQTLVLTLRQTLGL